MTILNIHFHPANTLVTDDYHAKKKTAVDLNRKMSLVFNHLASGVYCSLNLIKEIACQAFLTLNAICSDPSVLFHGFRRLDKNVLPYVESKNGFNPYSELSRVIRSSLTIFDAIYVAYGLDYFINKKYVSDNSYKIAANASLFTAHIALFCKEVIYLRMFKLENVSKNTGVQSVFRSSPLILFGIANGFFALHAFLKLKNVDTLVEKRDLQLDLTKNVVDLTLYAIMLSGIVSIGYLCAMGCLSMTFGASSVFYKYEHKKELLACKQLV